MPFGQYDLHSEVYDRFCEEQIRVIVLLASDEECLHKTGCNLRALYLKEGFQVLYLPIPDFGVPTKDDLEQTAQQTIAYAQAGHHIVIRCSAGMGRTRLLYILTPEATLLPYLQAMHATELLITNTVIFFAFTFRIPQRFFCSH